MKNKIINLILIVVILLTTLSNKIFAVNNSVIDTTQKGSLTITKYEHQNGNKDGIANENTNENIELEGVEFTIYKVNEEIQNIEEAKEYIKSQSLISKLSKITDGNGVVKFENLELGRYFVEETNTPINVLEPIQPFLIDIPSTNNGGNKWDYDVKVYPKNTTVYGDVTLKAVNNKNEGLENVKLKLQKNNNDKWYDYLGAENLVTDNNGLITLHNLPAGKYRLVATEVIDGYILDESNTQDFTISLDNTDEDLEMLIEKPEMKIEVLLNNGEYGNYIGANLEDTTTWKIEAKVPTIINKMKTYKINNTLSNGLTCNENTIQINGIDNSDNKTLLINNTDYNIQKNGQELILNFTNENLTSFKELEITYDTTFNDDVIFGNDGNANTVSLTYTSSIDLSLQEQGTSNTEDNEAEVHTGKVLVYKTDGKNALKGAIFRIATSKENAQNGRYITYSNGDYIEAVSNEQGYVIFEGLSYGNDNIPANQAETSYWIVETQAPSYEENGETKYYKLLSKPVEIKVNSISGDYSENTIQVINKKSFTLPTTGGIGVGITILIGALVIGTAVVLQNTKKKE